MVDAVSPTQLDPKYDITLSDGSDTLGFVITDSKGERVRQDRILGALQRQGISRTALKTSEGGSAYSDFELPYMPLDQDDWTGGRGSNDFEDDRTRFYDNYRCQVTSQGIILGGVETYSSGLTSQDVYSKTPEDIRFLGLYSTTRYAARKFTASATYDATSIEIILKYQGTPGVVTIELWSDNAGSGTPDAIIGTSTKSYAYTTMDENLPRFVRATVAAATLTSGTAYWVVVYGASTDNATNHWRIGYNYVSESTNTANRSGADGSSWPSSKYYLWFRTTPTPVPAKPHFFEYKSGFYCAISPDSGANSSLWINGDRGAADANTGALTTLVDASKTWTADEWIGGIVKITAGPGSEEAVPYRAITDNDATTLTVSPAWNTEHTTSTEYVLSKADKWTVLDSDLDGSVTDVAVAGEYVYFARGEINNDNVLRYQAYNVAGTWTERQDAESVEAVRILAIRHPEDDNFVVYGTQEMHELYGTCIWKGTVPPAWGDLYIDKGEIASTETQWLGAAPAGSVTIAINGANMELVIAAGAATGNLAQFSIATANAVDITSGSAIAALCKSTVAIAANDLRFELDGHALIASPVDYNFPALSADIWTWVTIDIPDVTSATTPADYNAVVSGAFNMVVDKGAFSFFIQGGLRLISTAVTYIDLPNDMRINRLVAYSGNQDDPRENPWIITEGAVYELQTQNDDALVQLPIGEMTALRSSITGSGAGVNDVYLYFNLGRKLERLFGRNLDDIGPDRDEGLPSNRQGDPAFLISYPGKVVYGINAGSTGFSSVMMLNGEAFWEIYRAPYGDPIRGGYVQPIAGSGTQRLWIYRDGGMLWIPISTNPLTDADYKYTHEGWIESAWVYSTMKGIKKVFKSITLVMEDLTGAFNVHMSIFVDYKTASTWTAISEVYDDEPQEEHDLASTAPTGYRIKHRERMQTTDSSYSPRLVATVINAYGIAPIKHAYQWTTAIEDEYQNPNIENEKDLPFGYTSRVEDAISKLDTWASALTPLTMRCRFSPFDNKTVILQDPVPLPLTIDSFNQQEKHLVQLTVHDI